MSSTVFHASRRFQVWGYIVTHGTVRDGYAERHEAMSAALDRMEQS